MALLTAARRRKAFKVLQRLGLCTGSYLKDDGLAAADNADVWRDNNTASYNSSLPLPYRTAANAADKAALLAFLELEATPMPDGSGSVLDYLAGALAKD
jgi:hypothetical protein